MTIEKSTQPNIASNIVGTHFQLDRRNIQNYYRYRDASYSRREQCFYDSPTISNLNKRLKAHKICRLTCYDGSIPRFYVPDDKVFWHIPFPDYKPIEYTTQKILNNPRADSADPSNIRKFNDIDGKIDRRSFAGHYFVDPKSHRPINPIGRTGVTGRGRLYYWGPNHAGDSIVTRWLRTENNAIVYCQRTGFDMLKPILEFVTIQREDTKQWALPGGMVDPDENVSKTIKREFEEEAIGHSIDKDNIHQLFSNGHVLYQSYIDDPRNTDNAWIETVAMHFHDETGELTKDLYLNAGDDAKAVMWRPIDRHLELYASHKDIIKKTVDRLDAYW